MQVGAMHSLEEEEELMKELQRRTQHILTPRLSQDNTIYYRFLKARDFDVNLAESLLLKNLYYWGKYKLEENLKSYCPPKHLSTYFASSFLGFDKDDCLIRYLDFGGMDSRGMVEMFDIDEILEYVLEYSERDLDRMNEHSEKIGKPVSKINVIMNMDKLSLQDVFFIKGLDYVREFLKVYQIMHPERAKSVCIINTTAAFSFLFNMMKIVVSNELLKKTKLYGRNGWKEHLLEEIDANVLPAFLGGNRTDPDGNPLCNSFVVHGQKIPRELCEVNDQDAGVRKVSVSAGSQQTVDIKVSRPEAEIVWEFETKEKGLTFSLLYRGSTDCEFYPEVLIQNQVINALQTGAFKCEKAGAYSIVFANSNSWFYSKEILCRIRCIEPQETNN